MILTIFNKMNVNMTILLVFVCPLMRKLLFFAAINAVKSKGIMHEKYQQMLDRGMPKMKALIAISRKLLGLIFAIVRDNTKYLENYSDNDHYKLAA